MSLYSQLNYDCEFTRKDSTYPPEAYVVSANNFDINNPLQSKTIRRII